MCLEGDVWVAGEQILFDGVIFITNQQGFRVLIKERLGVMVRFLICSFPLIFFLSFFNLFIHFFLIVIVKTIRIFVFSLIFFILFVIFIL